MVQPTRSGEDELAAPARLERNLLILHSPNSQHISDWQTVKQTINQRAPDIDVRIGTNGQPNSIARRWQITRPSLVFSPIRLIDYAPRGGTIYAGRPMGKLEELGRLIGAGLPVPKVMELMPTTALSPDIWGEFVVVKPKSSYRGEGVRLVRTEKVPALYDEMSFGGRMRLLVQRYIENLDEEGRQHEFRVLTMFTRPLYSLRRSATKPRRPLAELAADPGAKITVNPADGHARRMADEPDVLALASRVAAALPELPVLGLDILRDRRTGKLHILETNPSGHVWHLSSQLTLERIDAEHRAARYNQFGALSLAADLLIAKTREEAS